MKKCVKSIVICFVLILSSGMSVLAAGGGMISVKPAYTPSIGVNIPKKTVIGTLKPFQRVGGFYPSYGIYYNGVRYTSRRERIAAMEAQKQPQTQIIKVIHEQPAIQKPMISSCNGLTYYDKEGNITACR